MAIVQVGATETATSPSAGTLVVNRPAGVQDGDVLIAVGCHNEAAFSSQGGFTLHTSVTGATTPNTFSVHLWRKVASSEPSTYTFTGDTVAGAPLIVAVSAWRGVDTTTPIDTVTSTGGGDTAEPANPATSITTTNNARVQYVRGVRNTSGIPTFSTATGGWTELADIGDFSGGTVRYALGYYTETADRGPAAGITEPAVSAAGFTTETDNGYILWALRATPPADTDTGSGTEGAESIAGTAVDTDTGTGSETEFVAIPIADSDTGSGTEGAESIVQLTHHIQSDDFNRDNESPLNVSSSGAVWTNI